MLFRRRTTQTDSTAAIAAFWTWWSGAHDRIRDTIESGRAATLAGEVNAQVNQINPDLQWEFARGARSRHALVVSAGGDARVRAAAARWLAEAPGPDEVWEYHRSRQADPSALSARIEAGGHALDLSELQFSYTVDMDRRCVDVVAYHPGFGGVPDGMQAQVTFLALDWLLGEDAVEIWVGAVEWSTTPVADAQPPAALAAAVAELSAPTEEPQWTLARGQDRSGELIVAAMQRPLRSARWPQFDTHVAVVLPYRMANEGGLPIDGSLTALRAFEDDISRRLDVHGRLVAHESHGGRRTLHYYVDGLGEGVQTIKTSLTGWPEGRATATDTYDPEFAGVRHLA
jgi:hypothetical protein